MPKQFSLFGEEHPKEVWADSPSEIGGFCDYLPFKSNSLEEERSLRRTLDRFGRFGYLTLLLCTKRGLVNEFLLSFWPDGQEFKLLWPDPNDPDDVNWVDIGATQPIGSIKPVGIYHHWGQRWGTANLFDIGHRAGICEEYGRAEIRSFSFDHINNETFSTFVDGLRKIKNVEIFSVGGAYTLSRLAFREDDECKQIGAFGQGNWSWGEEVHIRLEDIKKMPVVVYD